MDDLISRQAAIDAIKKAMCEDGFRSETGLIHKTTVYEIIRHVPSGQPEIKPIEYRDCANAMLRMWIDNVVTDGEYNRIMDKLNVHWGMENK